MQLDVLARREVGVGATMGAQNGGGRLEVRGRGNAAHAAHAHHRPVVLLLVDAEAGGLSLERLGVDPAGDVVRPRGHEILLEFLHVSWFLS